MVLPAFSCLAEHSAPAAAGSSFVSTLCLTLQHRLLLPTRNSSVDGTLSGCSSCKLIFLLKTSLKHRTKILALMRGSVHLLVSKQNDKVSELLVLLMGRRNSVAG